MRKELRSFMKIMCFTGGVLIVAQFVSMDSFSVVIPRLEALIILEVICGLVFLLVRE